jgi:hypothetical protein
MAGIRQDNRAESDLFGFNIPNLTESHPAMGIQDASLMVSAVVGVSSFSRMESHPGSLMQEMSLNVSAVVGFNTPSRMESHPDSVRQEESLALSLVVFSNPCLMESQEDSRLTGAGGVVFSAFVQA